MRTNGMSTMLLTKLAVASSLLMSLLLPAVAQTAPEVDSTAATSSTPTSKLTGCYLKGISEQVQCGSLSVPQDYAAPDAKQLTINYAVLPAVSESKRPDPLLILAGGPGQAAVELAPMINRIFADVRKRRDILLIDQRGTGQSEPLSCSLSHEQELVKTDDDVKLDEMARECLAQFEQYDLTQFHSLHAIKDFEQVRQHLGYQQVNLYGGSYGSRAGLIYLREFPQSVRTAVLDAVAPPQVIVGPFGRHGADAFNKLLEQCRASSACADTFPNLGDTYVQVLKQLEQQPQLISIKDPLTNEPLEIMVTAGRFSSVMRVGLYHPTTRQMLPYVIDQTAKANYTPLVGLLGTTTAQAEIYMGLMLSVLCSEDLARATPELLAADGDNDFIGSRTGDAFVQMCSVWPQAERPSEWFAPVASDIPTLLLSGRLDPVTPPTWGALAAQTLTNSRHVIAEHGSHTIVSHTCANQLVAKFLETADPAGLDTSCIETKKAVPFILNSNGKGL